MAIDEGVHPAWTLINIFSFLHRHPGDQEAGLRVPHRNTLPSVGHGPVSVGCPPHTQH